MKKLFLGIIILVITLSSTTLVFAEIVNDDDIPRGYSIGIGENEI